MHAQAIAEDAGEIKAQRKKSTSPIRDSDLWYERYPRRFREATSRMPFELRSAYALVVDLYFESGAPFPDDNKWIAAGLYIDVRKWNPIRKKLFALGKLYIGKDGLIHNDFADELLAKRRAIIECERRSSSTRGRRRRTATSPSKSGLKSQSNYGLNSGDFSEKPNENNGCAQHKNINSNRDNGEVESLPPKENNNNHVGAAALILLDDHRSAASWQPSEDQLTKFRTLCDTFGRKAGAMVMRPTPRDESDAVLVGVCKDLSAYRPDIGRRALDAALSAVEAKISHDRQTGAAGRSPGGISPLVGYLQKAIRSKAADIATADAAAQAKMLTERAIQERLAGNRMDGMENGGKRRRRSTSSWEDLAAEEYGAAEA